MDIAALVQGFTVQQSYTPRDGRDVDRIGCSSYVVPYGFLSEMKVKGAGVSLVVNSHS
jgi:hypothetical protein